MQNNSITLQEVITLSDKGLLPKANYDSFDLFLKTISDEDLGEMINLSKSNDAEMLEFLSYSIAFIFMNEYDQEECTEVDLANLFHQFQRQCIAEAMSRVGLWDATTEERRLIPTLEPLEFSS